MPPSLAALVAQHFRWSAWETLVEEKGTVVERPHRSPHPHFPEIIYPIDYGYVCDTHTSDGGEVDIFLGTGSNRLVGAIVTHDYRRGDHEIKLLWNCTPEEIYLVNGFINFDRSLMEGTLALRYPMHTLWRE